MEETMQASKLRSLARKKQWQLQDAKNRLSQLVDQALQDGPQTITLRGKPAAVVISAKTFEKITRPRISLTEFFRQSPLQGMELDLKRKRDFSRRIDL
jgi:prevent-host-death family protein